MRVCDTHGVTFLDGPVPRAFAHRGWHIGDLAGCENSLAAFRRAVAEGFDYLETDVHVTRDGVLVAFHDDTLDRATDARGRIADLPYRLVQKARIGGREPIPTLVEVLEACPTARINIDPKSDAAVAPLLAALHEARATDRVCIGSFSDRRLRAVRRSPAPIPATSLSPRHVASMVIRAMVGLPIRRGSAVAAQVPLRVGRARIVTPRLLSAAHRAHLEVHVWTIDDREVMERLLDLGVDGIMTDRPDVLREVLRRRGAWR